MNAVGNIEPFTIYVPQGRCARIDGTAVSRNVKSLFTNDFSTCNIVAFQGKRSVSLIHFDTVTKRDILMEELEWTKEPVEVTVCHRAGIADSTKIRDDLVDCLYHFCGDKKIEINSMELSREESGIELTAEIALDGTLKYDIKFHSNQGVPERLIRHPQELFFLTAIKIEQLYTIGNFNFPRKQAVIFDGESWQQIPKTELTPFCPSDKEQALLDTLKSCARNPAQIRETLCQLAQKYTSEENAIVHANNVLPNALDYANSYDFVLIFKKRMIEVLERRTQKLQGSHASTSTRDEQKCLDELLDKVKSGQDSYREVSLLMRRYAERFFHTHFSDEMRQIADHYRVGKMYDDLVQERVRGIAEVQRLVEESNMLSQEGKIAEAAGKLRLSLFTAQKHMTVDNALMATCKTAYRRVLESQNPLKNAHLDDRSASGLCCRPKEHF